MILWYYVKASILSERILVPHLKNVIMNMKNPLGQKTGSVFFKKKYKIRNFLQFLIDLRY